MKTLLCYCVIVCTFCSNSLSLFAGKHYRLSLEQTNGMFQKTGGSHFSSIPALQEQVRLIFSSDPAAEIEVIVEDGEHYLEHPLDFTPKDISSKGFLTFKARNKGGASFISAKRLNHWEQVPTRTQVWRCRLNEPELSQLPIEQLYVNGRRATLSRLPNEGMIRVLEAKERAIEDDALGHNQVEVSIRIDSAQFKSLLKLSSAELAQTRVIVYHKWDNTRKYITRIEPSNNTIVYRGEPMKPWNPINAGSMLYFESVGDALSETGQWTFDPEGWIYYIPMKGEEMRTAEIYYPTGEQFVVMRGDASKGEYVENIRFEGLNFKYAGYHTPDMGNEPMQAAARIGAAIELDDARNIHFVDCEVSHIGRHAFWFRNGCSDCSVEHSLLSDLGGGGVKIGHYELVSPYTTQEMITQRIKVDNNIITQCGRVFPCAVGVTIFHSSDNTITHNEISDLFYSGVSLGWVWGYTHSFAKRNKVEFNHIHHIGWGELSDMGAVYTLGASEGTSVSNNVIHDVYSFDYGGWGLYTDEGSYGVTMENNLVYRCKSAGFHQHYGKENIIRNNIFALNYRGALQATRIEAHRSFNFEHNIVVTNGETLGTSNWVKVKQLSDNNLFWDIKQQPFRFDGGMKWEEWLTKGADTHSLVSDPLFRDIFYDDFRFRSQNTIKQINFCPFDYSKAGVYGSRVWKQKARMLPERMQRFSKMVELREAASVNN